MFMFRRIKNEKNTSTKKYMKRDRGVIVVLCK